MLWFLLLIASGGPGASAASPNWEACLDSAEFTFNQESFTQQSTTISKAGCLMKFAKIGGRGEKFEVNFCDPSIHIDHYDAIDSGNFTRLKAPQSACPNPGFGANYEENGVASQEFDASRKRLLEMFEAMRKDYGANADKVDLSDPRSFSAFVSDGKFACGAYLLTEYLMNCIAFEAKKLPPSAAAPQPSGPLPPGVLPMHIPKPAASAP